MQLQNHISVSLLISFTIAHVCTDDWELVYVQSKPVCWALLNAVDFRAGYDHISKVCDSANGKAVTIQNSAEKSVLADLANRAQEPTLTCYKSSQKAVKYKSVDFERVPEYLKILNEKGRVKLSRGIQMGDEIAVTFSMKVSKNQDREILSGQIRIENSSNSSHFAMNMICHLIPNQVVYVCELSNPGATQKATITFYKAEQKIISVEYFATVTFRFLDKEIEAWGRADHKLTVSLDYPYTEMDEISIENILVSNIEHTKKCTDMDPYQFETEDVDIEEFPRHSRDGLLVPIRYWGPKHTFVLPENRFDYYKPGDPNAMIFDVFVLKMKDKNEWGLITIDFWNRESDTSIFKLSLTDQQFTITYLDSNSTPITTNPESISVYQINGYRFLGFRFKTSEQAQEMIIETNIFQTGRSIPTNSIKIPLRDFDEIRLEATSGSFYDVKMKALKEVFVMTCNYRGGIWSWAQEDVPYRSFCYTKRNVLCQKDSLALPVETIPDEPREKYIWKEEAEPEVITLKEEEKKVEEQKKEIQKKIEAEKRVEEAEEIREIEEFQWIITGLTTLTFASVLAIIILNLIRCFN